MTKPDTAFTKSTKYETAFTPTTKPDTTLTPTDEAETDYGGRLGDILYDMASVAYDMAIMNYDGRNKQSRYGVLYAGAGKNETAYA